MKGKKSEISEKKTLGQKKVADATTSTFTTSCVATQNEQNCECMGPKL